VIRLLAGRLKNLSSNLVRVEIPFPNKVRIGSGAHPASYRTCNGGSIWGVKRLRRETNNLASSSATVRSVTTSVRDNPYGVVIKHQHSLPLPLQISLLDIKVSNPITGVDRP